MIKNLGQVAAIHISNQAPVNKKIVWVDTNENPYVFKLYDVNKWVPIATQEWTANFINGWVITLKPADEASADDYLLLNKGGENYKITVDAFVRSAIGNPLDFKGVIRKDSDFPSPETVQGGDMYVVITGNPDVTVTDPNTGQTFSDTEKIVWDTVTKNWASLGKIEIEVNLGTKYTDTAVEVTSSAGESAIINPATDSTAGIMSALLYKYLTALSNGTIIPGVTTGETPGHKHNYDDIVNRLISQQAEGDSTRNPMSQDAVTKALFKKFDKTSVVQTTGAGKDVVMSQDITTKELNKRLLLSGGTMTGSIKSTIGNILLNNNGEALIYQESANKNNYFGSALENTFLRSKGDVGLIKGSSQYKLWDSENLPDPVKQSYSLHFDIMESYVAARFFNAAVGKKAADTYIEWWQSTNEGGGGWFNFQLGSLTANGSIKSTGLITATNGVQIGSTSDVGWFNNNNRICAGMSSAKGVNVGSLLISDKWVDASKVPTNGIYSKGVTINDEHFIIGYTSNLTGGKWGYGFHYLDNVNNGPYSGLGVQYSQGCLSLYQKIRPKKGAEGWEWTGQNNLSSQNGIYLKLGFTKLLFGFAEKGDFASGETATVKEYGIWTEKELTKPKFAYGFEAIATGTSSIDLNTIFSETNGGYVYNYSGASKWVNAPLGMSYGGVYQLGYSGTLNGLYLQIAGDIVHAENNSKTGRLWYRMPGNGGLATAGWKRLLTEEDDLPNVLTKEKADTYYYPINGKGSLSFTSEGNPLLDNNQGIWWKDYNGKNVEAIWLGANNNLVLGKSNASTGTLNNILIRGNLKTETGLNDYLYNNYDTPKFSGGICLYANTTGGWSREINWRNNTNSKSRAGITTYGSADSALRLNLGVITEEDNEGGWDLYNKQNTLEITSNNVLFGNKSLAVWGTESNALTKLLYNRTLTINGTGWSVVGTASGNMSTIYAPTTVGTAGQILQSNGSGAPVWADVTGLAIQNSLKTTDKKTYADPVASYVTSDTGLQGIRIKLPFKDTSGKMVQFSIRFSGSYSFIDLVVFFYLYNNNGGYVYNPAVRMADGTTSVPVKIGSADDGTVYVWVGGLTQYYGVLVHDVAAAFTSGDWSTGWEITTGDASIITDVRYDKTVDPPLTSVSIATISDLHSTWDAFMKAGLYTRNIGVNGSQWTFLSNVDGATTSVYAPTSAGTSGQFLKSTGGVPSWVDLTPALIGAAAASHTHTLAQISDLGSTWDAYLKAGIYERNIVFNGTTYPVLTDISGATAVTFYAPTNAGTSGQTLLSTGGVPGWGYPFILSGEYKGNGGVIAPSEIGSGKVYHRMMRNNPTGGSTGGNGYCDWLLMDCYTGSDIPYVTGIGVTKTASPAAFIISAPKGNTEISSWVRKQLATTDLLSSYLPLSGGELTGTLSLKNFFQIYDSSKATRFTVNKQNGEIATVYNIDSAGLVYKDLVIGRSSAQSGSIFFDASTNRIGVGTSSPAEAFHVNGNIKATTFIGNIAWDNVTGKPASFSTSIANITDLNSSWDAILKASATSATFTPKAHNQASNTITAMTGYVKGSSQTAISTSDNLNTAIAKLEVKADSKLTTTSSSAGQATNVIVVTELPSSPEANTLYLIVEV